MTVHPSKSHIAIIGPFLWGHSGPLCHALSLSILHCHSSGVATVARRLRYSYSWLRLILVVVSTVATPGEWQCKIITGGVWRLAVANGPNIFQMLLVCESAVKLQTTNQPVRMWRMTDKWQLTGTSMKLFS